MAAFTSRKQSYVLALNWVAALDLPGADSIPGSMITGDHVSIEIYLGDFFTERSGGDVWLPQERLSRFANFKYRELVGGPGDDGHTAFERKHSFG
ncbi:MAG TPA: hypothetical protein VNI36_09440 [Candidatus Dormibacteraeota bacterium]|nr:hypothetical protein [Candidatus Dormibacteraeota bacterium]